MVPDFISKRNSLYQSLQGNGLEIGAFEHPAVLPEVCKVTYCDVISKTEALKLFPEVNKEELDEVDVILDIDKSGFIDYSEFVLASMTEKQLISESNLKAAYNMFDKDGSGSISADEIKAVIGNVNLSTDEI